MSSETERLEKDIERLKRELEKVRHEKEKVEDKLKKVEKEFAEFKAKHAITVEHLQKALKIKPDKKSTGNPVGATPGHKGYFRRIPERIDHIKSLIPVKCPDCDGPLSGTQEIRQRYVIDVRLISRARTTQYDIHRKYCRTCKKLVELPVPNTLPRAKYGLNLMLLVLYLKLGMRLSGNKIVDYLTTIHGIQMGEGEIAHILKQLATEYGEYYLYLKKLIRLARVKHSDSTSWNVNGRRYNAWVFVAAGVVLYKIAKRNNAKVPLSVFGTKQQGNILVVDRHSVFRTLAEKAGFTLQLCWAHITDDSRNLAKAFGREGRYIHREIKRIFALADSLNHKGTPEQVEQLQAEIFALTQRHYKSTTLRRFVDNLWKRDVNNLFLFVMDPNIDSTNNLSERELRELVIIRKISNGSRSKNGAKITAELLSVIQTLRIRKENVLQGLQQILANPSLH